MLWMRPSLKFAMQGTPLRNTRGCTRDAHAMRTRRRPRGLASGPSRHAIHRPVCAAAQLKKEIDSRKSETDREKKRKEREEVQGSGGARCGLPACDAATHTRGTAALAASGS